MTKIEKNGASFIEKAILKYENRYDYSLVSYSGYNKKVEIFCNHHGSFFQTPEVHLLSKDGCQKCANDTRAVNLSLTKEDFIKRAITQFGDKYNYTKVNYTGCEKKVQIGCKKHGFFKQTPSGHLRNGNGCKECTKENRKTNKKTTEQFVEKAKEKHGNKYDYSKVIYTKAIEDVTIICSLHGEFKQKASGHLTGHGCHICAINTTRDTKIKTTEQVVSQAKEVHKDKYNYDKVNYKNNLEKITIICNTHGEFKQTASNHLQGQGCPKCANIYKTTEQFIKEANALHNNKYSYIKTKYKYDNEKIVISCKIHGDFLQTPSAHLQNCGCPKCGWESHWRRSDYIKKANGRECIFYTLRCFNEEEEFYKIGITMNSIKTRYKSSKDIPYQYEVISGVKGKAGFIWDLERDEKKKLKLLHYTPKLRFGGSETECFTDYKLQ